MKPPEADRGDVQKLDTENRVQQIDQLGGQINQLEKIVEKNTQNIDQLRENIDQLTKHIDTTISPKGKEISVLPEGVERYTLTELNRRLMVRFVATDLMALPNESVLDRA